MPRAVDPMFRGILLTALGGLAIDAHSDGFRVPYQGAAAAGQGEAFAAQADDASALFYNPAGLTQLKGVQASIGTNLVGGGLTYDAPNGERVFGDLGGSVAVPPPSNLYVTANLKDLGFEALGPLSVGLGIASPYGLIMRYPKDGPFSDIVTSTKLPLFDIKPTIAYQVTDMLSVGVGLDIYTFAGFLGEGHYSLKRGVIGKSASELETDGTGLGYNASLLLTPLRTEAGLPRLNLGFVYRSRTNLPMRGRFRSTAEGISTITKASVNASLPEVITAAVAYWPIRDAEREWKLEYDMDFVGWDEFKSFDVKFPGGSVSSIPQEWQSIWTASFGSEYKWIGPDALPDWDVSLRAGYQHSNTPIPEATFSPAVPDSDWNLVAIGIGMTCKPGGQFLGVIGCGRADQNGVGRGSIGVDLAFQTAFFDSRTVKDNRVDVVNGTYRATLYVGSVNFRVAF